MHFLTGGGLLRKKGMKKSRFSTNISLHLGNDTRKRHSYNGILRQTYTRPVLRKKATFNDVRFTSMLAKDI